MSSYSSLSRVLSPFRVQTKIEENTSHIFKMRKALTCFVMRSFNEFTIVVADEIPIDNSSVPIKDFNVGLLKKHIWKEISYDFDGSGIVPNRLNLWKAEIPVSEENRKVLENPEIEYIKQTFKLKKLDQSDMFLDEEVFPDKYKPPHRHIHIIVEPPPPPATTGLKRPISDQNMRPRKLVRTDGPVDVSENFCVPFGELDSTRILEDAIAQNLCALLVGHFQSGKTSVLHYLSNTKANYFYVHSSNLSDANGFLSGLCNLLSLNQCSSCASFCDALKNKYKEKIVILIDEFDRFLFNSKKNKNLECMIDEVRELTKLISDKSIGIKSIVYTGTYSIVAMLKDGVPQIRKVIESASQESIDSLSGGDSLFGEESESERLSHASSLLEPEPIPSPLNSAKTIQASDFTRDQHMSFFKDIQEDRHIRISEDVLDDIYSVTNGYAGLEGLLASLCMEYSVNEKSLEFNKWNERFTEFRRNPTNHQIKAVNHIEKHLSDRDDKLIENAKNLLGRFLQSGTLDSSKIREDDISAIMHLQAIGIIKDLDSKSFGFTSNIISDLLSTNYYPLYRKGLGTIPDINEPRNFLKDVLGLLKFIHHDVIFHSLAANLHSFSEAIVQGELYALLRSAVSNPAFRLFRETRTLKRSEKKCDLWLCSDSKEYGIECKVNYVSNGEIDSATKQALGYTRGRKNSCSMFLLNFVPFDSISKNHDYYFPCVSCREGFYFAVVYILYSKANRNAQIYRHDANPEEIPFATER